MERVRNEIKRLLLDIISIENLPNPGASISVTDCDILEIHVAITLMCGPFPGHNLHVLLHIDGLYDIHKTQIEVPVQTVVDLNHEIFRPNQKITAMDLRNKMALTMARTSSVVGYGMPIVTDLRSLIDVLILVLNTPYLYQDYHDQSKVEELRYKLSTYKCNKCIHMPRPQLEQMMYPQYSPVHGYQYSPQPVKPMPRKDKPFQPFAGFSAHIDKTPWYPQEPTKESLPPAITGSLKWSDITDDPLPEEDSHKQGSSSSFQNGHSRLEEFALPPTFENIQSSINKPEQVNGTKPLQIPDSKLCEVSPKLDSSDSNTPVVVEDSKEEESEEEEGPADPNIKCSKYSSYHCSICKKVYDPLGPRSFGYSIEMVAKMTKRNELYHIATPSHELECKDCFLTKKTKGTNETKKPEFKLTKEPNVWLPIYIDENHWRSNFIGLKEALLKMYNLNTISAYPQVTFHKNNGYIVTYMFGLIVNQMILKLALLDMTKIAKTDVMDIIICVMEMYRIYRRCAESGLCSNTQPNKELKNYKEFRESKRTEPERVKFYSGDIGELMSIICILFKGAVQILPFDEILEDILLKQFSRIKEENPNFTLPSRRSEITAFNPTFLAMKISIKMFAIYKAFHDLEPMITAKMPDIKESKPILYRIIRNIQTKINPILEAQNITGIISYVADTEMFTSKLSKANYDVSRYKSNFIQQRASNTNKSKGKEKNKYSSYF